eukprot:TRINITY_DN348_c4_g1_i1.p1 TRINITY_DN348_c4_g1~~TRINITY_DN348_c4_g1_i1.p1  ORF type:complete len:171 (+),score=40.06 TRINITY_DN348_c4_g1_i1:61-513(+)
MIQNGHRLTIVGCISILCCLLTYFEWVAINRTKGRIREAINDIDQEYKELVGPHLMADLQNAITRLKRKAEVEASISEPEIVEEEEEEEEEGDSEQSQLELDIIAAVNDIKEVTSLLSNVTKRVKAIRKNLEPYIDKVSQRSDRMLYNYI